MAKKKTIRIVTPVYEERLAQDFNTRSDPFQRIKIHQLTINLELVNIFDEHIVVKQKASTMPIPFGLIKEVWSSQHVIEMAIDGKIIINDENS